MRTSIFRSMHRNHMRHHVSSPFDSAQMPPGPSRLSLSQRRLIDHAASACTRENAAGRSRCVARYQQLAPRFPARRKSKRCGLISLVPDVCAISTAAATAAMICCFWVLSSGLCLYFNPWGPYFTSCIAPVPRTSDYALWRPHAVDHDLAGGDGGIYTFHAPACT